MQPLTFFCKTYFASKTSSVIPLTAQYGRISRQFHASTPKFRTFSTSTQHNEKDKINDLQEKVTRLEKKMILLERQHNVLNGMIIGLLSSTVTFMVLHKINQKKEP